jgi:hypothetical protein
MAGEFLAWRRSGVHDLGTGSVEGGRRQAQVALKLESLGGGGEATEKADFELMGPLDVDGLLPGAVVGRVPAPGSVDASETRFAHVELAPEDLPWRFTPEPPDADRGLKPWIVLVVAEATEAKFTGERVQLAPAALEKHELASSSRWAHVHAIGDGARRLARIVSPRDLRGETDYVAVVVPAFVEDEKDPTGIKPAWAKGDGATVRWYDSWTFRTGPDGDFQTIAARLQPKTAAEIGKSFGVAEILHKDAKDPLPMRAALAAIPPDAAAQPDVAPPPPPVQKRVRELTEPLAVKGRWVLQLPAYDGPWSGPEATPWRQALRADPRRRAAAGLGAWAAIGWQERIADAAAAQAGALAAAAERIRHLTIGLATARSLWERRVPEDSNPIARLALLGPALARIPAAGDSETVLDHINGRVPGRLVPALFSSAARRVLRPGPARSALAAPGAGGLEAVLEAANACPPAPKPDPLVADIEGILAEGPHASHLVRELVERARERVPKDESGLLEDLLGGLPGWVSEEGRLIPPDLIAAFDPGGGRPPDLEALARVVDGLRGSEPTGEPGEVVAALEPVFAGGGGAPACRPFALGELAAAVAAAVDPTVDRPVVVDRVLATIQGLEEPLLAPPDLSPELDLPLWKFLDERQRDWLLPGAGLMPSDSVAMVQTNPAFVDAFLLGANQQTLGELRWRNLPVRTGWTPLRRFWSRFPAPELRNTDIEGVALWPADSELGDPRHRTDPVHGEDLVVVFRTELFRRYPSTLVYLFPAELDAKGNPSWETTPKPVESLRLYPIFNGSVGPEVVFFGFAVPPRQGETCWVVLEEPPPGFRFGPPASPSIGAENGGTFAEATFRRPVRVFLGALL